MGFASWLGEYLLENPLVILSLFIALAVPLTAYYWRHDIPKAVAKIPPLPSLPPLPEPVAYTHDANEMIERFGNWAVVGLKVRRAPVMEVLSGIINATSGGTWAKALQKQSYSSVFHLGIVVELESPCGAAGAPRQESELLLEKNEVICISWPGAAWELTEYKRIRFAGGIPPQGLTLKRLLDCAQASVAESGRNYFAYDAFRGQNCQDFVQALMSSLRDGTAAENIAEVDAFVKQDIDALLRDLPDHVARMARAVTDAGAALTGVVDEARHRIKRGVQKLHEHAA